MNGEPLVNEEEGAASRGVEAQAGLEEIPVGEGGAAAQLEQARRERDEFLDVLRRVQADFDNYRKRVAREHAERVALAGERIVRELVPLLDDLERALASAADHGEDSVADGVRLVHRALQALLEREGLVEIRSEGRFDPHTQEAVGSAPSPKPEGTVLEVVQRGYRLGNRVVRPARVVVSSGRPPGHRSSAREPGAYADGDD